MKAEETRQVTTRTEELARNADGAVAGAEADVTTRRRTKAELEQGSGLMEVVCERGNLMLAFQRVVENKGAAGVDGIVHILCGSSILHSETYTRQYLWMPIAVVHKFFKLLYL